MHLVYIIKSNIGYYLIVVVAVIIDRTMISLSNRAKCCLSGKGFFSEKKDNHQSNSSLNGNSSVHSFI